MSRIATFVLAASILLLQAARAADFGDTMADADVVALGQRIYREGILPSGKPLHGIAQAGVQRSGSDAACATCHRRSGYGSSEGSLEIRSITGPALFGKREARAIAPAPKAVESRLASVDPADVSLSATATLREARKAAFYGNRQRLPYDDASLQSAIRSGVDVTGRRLNDAMPRYALSDEELRSLTAYLRTLSAQSPPGISAEAIRFATVIQPGVDPRKRRAMLEVLQTYIKDRNASLRAEVRREQTGNVRLGRTYREWILDVWDLTGPPEAWESQLEAYYRRQPVFALVSGLASGSWQAIHAFSERYEVPCILPQTDLPVTDGVGFYTVYLSQGIVLEARALAKYLHEQGERAPVVQVFRRDAIGQAAAEAFRDAWKSSPAIALRDLPLAGEERRTWQEITNETSRSTLVLWLTPADVALAQALTDARSQANTIYLSSTLAAGDPTGSGFHADRRVRFLYPQELPAVREARLRPIRTWMHNKGLAPVDENVQMNAYFAAIVTAGAMSHNMDTLSREFLLERVEHRVGNAFDPSLYPHASLGPGQRFASKGSYIVELAGSESGGLIPVSSWIVP